MSILTGWGSRARALFADTKGPWGPSSSDGGEESPSGDGGNDGKGPWGGEQPRRLRRPSVGRSDV